MDDTLLLFFFTLVTGPRRSLRLMLSDAIVFEPQIRAGDSLVVHSRSPVVQGFLAHKKTPAPGTLHEGYAKGPTIVLGGGVFS